MSAASSSAKTRKTQEINKVIYTDWANQILEKSEIKDLPKDISDGVLLARIVEFICDKSVERIHKRPTSAKQKLHNIERCLSVLEENSVVLNDVSVQGIYRAELKCVLALFYHLSRYKQKETDFKMVDSAKSAQKRCLRPPSAVAVSRKSRSFNANDRNRINLDLSDSMGKCKTNPGSPVDAAPKPIGSGSISNRAAPTSNSMSNTGWRSKSMNVKHTASTKLLTPKALGSNLQSFKPDGFTTSAVGDKVKPRDNERSRIAPMNGLRKPSPVNRLSNAPATHKQSPATTTNKVETGLKPRETVAMRRNKPMTRPSSLAKPSSIKVNLGSKSASPYRSLERQTASSITPNRNVSSPITSQDSAEMKSTNSGSKSGSMISRLRKLGSPTSTSGHSSSTVKSRSTLASKKAVDSVSKSSISKKRAESCPPTSRLSTRPLSQQKTQVATKTTSSNEKSKTSSEKLTKPPPAKKSVKSSLGKALRSSKANDKKLPNSPQKSASSLKSGKKQHNILKSEICPIIPMVTNANLPVQPIYSLASDASEKNDDTGLTPSSDDVISSTEQSASMGLPSSNSHFVKPVGVSIASSRESRPKAHKTAMVAPFMRREVNEEEKEKKLSNQEKDLTKDEKAFAKPEESREMAVKGIADLRQNLEETMNSLRNTQLRHRKGDDFQRRVSAQMDGDLSSLNVLIDHNVSLSHANTICRSDHNLTSNRTGVITHAHESPRLHAGETLSRQPDHKFSACQFSSLQRTRSARSSRSSWGEDNEALSMTLKKLNPRYNDLKEEKVLNNLEHEPKQGWMKRKGSEDDASVSSGELSDYIGGVSTDELSSTNNSPQHQIMTTANPEQDGDDRTQLNSGLSKSTVDIDSSTKSLRFKKKGINKPVPGLRAPGSSVVGSRLACNATDNKNSSPCSSPSQRIISNLRGLNSYKSLPRPSKSKIFHEKEKSKFGSSQDGDRSSSPFKRSPSLQKLLGLGKPKQMSEENKTEKTNETYFNPHVISPSTQVASSSENASFAGHARLTFSSSNDPTSFQKDLSHYNTVGRPRRDAKEISSYSYLSLPRRSRARATMNLSSLATGHPGAVNTVMTWSPPKRPHANSAYSISPAPSNPYKDLLTTPSLNIDNKDSMNYFDPDSVLKNTDPDLFNREVSDWPLPSLVSSTSNIAGSNPDLTLSSGRSQQQQGSYLRPFSESNKSIVGTPPKHSAKHGESPLTEDSCKSKSQAQVHSPSKFGEKTLGINLHAFSNDARDNESELQKLKNNIELRMQSNSPDALSGTRSSSALKKKASCGSLNSIHSGVSASSVGSTEDCFKRKKKHWLRESLKTAFGKRKSRTNLNDLDEIESGDGKQPREEENPDIVAQLKEELIKKERKLTDIRLEALTSQHQLHQMQDAMHRMKSEIEVLRQENERLNKLGFSSMSLDEGSKLNQNKLLPSFSLQDRVGSDDSRIVVKVEFPSHMIDEDMDEQTNHVIIGVCYVSRSISWQELDEKVQRVLQNFCRTVSPETCLELDANSISSYTVGDACRVFDGEVPDLLPCGYIIGNVDSVTLKLKDGSVSAADALALELLIDRETVQRYVNLILEHGRVMLSGPAGTGKSTLANRLAEHIVRMNPKHPDRDVIVRLDLKHRSETKIADYLEQLSEDCSKPESSGKNIPVVLILDDLHRSHSIKEAILPLLTSAAHSQLPFLIGVAEHNSDSGLELHQEFRWIMYLNHTPPVSHSLSRTLKRSLCDWEVTNDVAIDKTVASVVEWLPECWKHVNKCIETFNSADVTLGPRLFTSCPMNAMQSLNWFINLWNFSVVPYIISAVKQGANKTRMNKVTWTDPLEWVKESWPWPSSSCDLYSIRAEDVALDMYSSGFDPHSKSEQNSDPLLNMMLKLREAAANNCESDTSHEESFEHRLDKALGDLS